MAQHTQKLHRIISPLWSKETFWIYHCHSISVASTNVTTRQEKSFRVQNMDLSGWIRRQCLVLGLSDVIIYGWRYSGVKIWQKLSVVCCDVPGTMVPGQSISLKAVWSRARGEGSSQLSTEDMMSGRVWGGVKSSCMSYGDKADSEDHAVAAALVLLFAFWFRRWWTFLFLEFPVEWQTQIKRWTTCVKLGHYNFR